MQYKCLKCSHFSSPIEFKFSFRTAEDGREIFAAVFMCPKVSQKYIFVKILQHSLHLLLLLLALLEFLSFSWGIQWPAE